MGWAILALVMSFAVGAVIGAVVQNKRHNHNHDEEKKDHKGHDNKKKGFLRKLGNILLWLPKKIWNLIRGKKQEEAKKEPEVVVEKVEPLPKMETETRSVDTAPRMSEKDETFLKEENSRNSGVRPR